MTWARAVPHDGQRFGVLLGEQPQPDFAVVGQRAAQIDLPAVDFGQNGRLRQPGPNFGGHIVGRDRPIELFPTSVGEDDSEHGIS